MHWYEVRVLINQEHEKSSYEKEAKRCILSILKEPQLQDAN